MGALDDALREIELCYCKQYALAERVSEMFLSENPTSCEWHVLDYWKRRAAVFELGPTGERTGDDALFDLLEEELRLAQEVVALAQERPSEATGAVLRSW